MGKKNHSIFLFFLCLLFVGSGKAQINADFTVNSTSGCSPHIVQFQSIITGSTPVSYTWFFGNGNSSNNANPGAIYITPGSYTVTLIVVDGLGNRDTMVKPNYITVFANPVANFTANPSSGCAPVSVNFVNTSTVGSAPITQYTWDFDDGNISSQQSPQHIYTSDGNYHVTLIVRDQNNCTNTITKNNAVEVYPVPEAAFSADKTSACNPPLNVNFTNQSTGNYTTSTWYFGNGNTSTQQNPSQNYQNVGTYDVKLIVQNSFGCKDSILKKDYISINTPNVNFTSNVTTGCSPLKVNFSNTTPGASAINFTWHFGDGNTSTSVNPSHTYAAPGTYSVKLVANLSSGCKDSIIKADYITVHPTPTADFTSITNNGCSTPHTVQFQNNSTGATNYIWLFQGAGTSTQNNPSVNYQNFGKFDVRLVAHNQHGCTDTLLKPEFVKIVPTEAGFESSVLEGCAPLYVEFTDTSVSNDPIVSWAWDFGNGQTSSLQHPNVTYTDTGRYKVTLTITTALGCISIKSFEWILVGQKVPPSFTGGPNLGCISDMNVTFINTTNDTATVKADRFYWEFGDGGTSEEENPTYLYDSDSGFYDVTLYSYHNGCMDSLVRRNYIRILPPNAKFITERVPCHPDSVKLINTSFGADSIVWNFRGQEFINIDTLRFSLPVGTHIGRLRAFNYETGCIDTQLVSVEIKKGPINLSIASAGFSGCAPFSFQAHASYSSQYTLTSFKWYFGNGDSASTSSVSYIYNTPGTYTVTLKVKDDVGCEFETSGQVVVSGPTVSFTKNPSTGCFPQLITFTENITSSSPIASRTWVFGDGNSQTTTSSSITHTYTKAPANQNQGFVVTLHIVDSQGCAASYSDTVFVSKPRPAISHSIVRYCDSLTVTYSPVNHDSVALRPYTVRWRFSDGSQSQSMLPTRTYMGIASETATLIITDRNGCVDSISRNFNFDVGMIKAGFTANPLSETCPPLQVTFTDTSISRNRTINNWQWNFGDGSRSTLKNPVKIYNIPGQFNVRLIITDHLGCKDTMEVKDLITIDGPIGNYSFDLDSGCVPLTVNFTAVSANASNFTWDLGDGNIKSGRTITHTYTTASTFIPLLILSNNAGCTYTLPPIDTIRTFNLPVADFSTSSFCRGYNTNFTNASIPGSGSIANIKWDFGDGATSTQENPVHIYQNAGIYNVSLLVENNKGCSASVQKAIKIGGIKTAFSMQDSVVCRNTPVSFVNESITDTLIAKWEWDFGDGNTSGDKDPVHLYDQPGIYSVRLIGVDVKGCSDTITLAQHVRVVDSLQPAPHPLLRVTVENNTTVQLDFSRYTGNDFSQYNIYRKNAAGDFILINTIQNEADTTYFDLNLNTLHNVYCYKVTVVTICGKESELDNTVAHCTVELTALPGDRRAFLNWNQYEGWNSIAEYEVYREDINNKGTFFKIGSVAGNVNEYIDSNIICYQTHFYRVKAIEAGGNLQVSWSDTSGTRPDYFPNVLAPDLTRATVENNENILVEWERPQVNIKEYWLERRDDNNYLWVQLATLPPSALSYIDNLTEVNDNSYTYRLRLVDSCDDVSGYSNIGKSILLKATSNSDFLPVLNWSSYQFWSEGVEFYEIQRKNADGTFTTVGRTATGLDTTFVDNVTDFNSLPYYCYRVGAHRAGHATTISMSNEACVDVPLFIYIPNAFSPNGDSINDKFEIKGMFIKSFHLQIYDRWGLLVFESFSLKDLWDGTYKGAFPVQDAYVYLVHVQGVNNQSEYISGSVTVLP